MSSRIEESAKPLTRLQESIGQLDRLAKRSSTLKGCQKANFDLAIENVKKMSNRYNNQGEQISINVDVQYFKVYGTGIYLFFHFAKRLAIVFSIFAVIYLFPIVFNTVKGGAYSSMINSLGIYFAQTSVGNLNNTPQSQTSLDLATSKYYKYVNVIPDITVCLIFLGFYLYWEVKSDKLTSEIRKQINFQCYYALQLTEFSQRATETSILSFFSQFGKIKEISTVKNYSEIIAKCKNIYEIQQARRQHVINLQNQLDESEQVRIKQLIKEYDTNISQIQTQIAFENQCHNFNILKYYVVFQSPSDRQKALKTLNSYFGLCKWGKKYVPKQHLLMGEKVRVVACHNEPGDIIWENQHINWPSRILRRLIQAILLLILILFTFCAISALNIATPSTSTNLDTNNYNANSIISVKNATILYVWCIENKSMMTSLTSINTLCTPYITRYYWSLAIGILITFVIVGVKTFLKKIVIFLARFQRYKEQTEQSIGIIRNLFYTYICTTVLITFLLQANIFNVSFKKFVGNFITNQYLLQNASFLQQYTDFTPFWYLDIGYKITLTWFILAFQTPIVNPLLSLLKQQFFMWLASKQTTQKMMEDKMKPQQFEIEDQYANILLIIFVGFAFSSGMPLIMIPCAFAFVLRYFYFKLTFIRFSRIPKSYDEALNENILNLLPFALIIHFLFGIWMYGTQSIFVNENSFINQIHNKTNIFSKNMTSIFQRFGNTWYYTISLLVCIGVLLLKMVFYDLIYENIVEMRDDERIPSVMLKKDQIIYIQPTIICVQPTKLCESTLESCLFKESTKISLASSYKIENNAQYFEVLAIMQRLNVLKPKN